MRLLEVEKKARSFGLKDVWGYSKKDLIRNIQRKEGNFDCFGKSKGFCDQTYCSWREDCLR